MISPHLIKVLESYSSCNSIYQSKNIAEAYAHDLFGNKPTVLLEQKKKSTWCHMLLAKGPTLNPDLNADSLGSQLVIIWWSEFEPDTNRVLQYINWEKSAKNYF